VSSALKQGPCINPALLVPCAENFARARRQVRDASHVLGVILGARDKQCRAIRGEVLDRELRQSLTAREAARSYADDCRVALSLQRIGAGGKDTAQHSAREAVRLLGGAQLARRARRSANLTSLSPTGEGRLSMRCPNFTASTHRLTVESAFVWVWWSIKAGMVCGEAG